MNTDSAVCFTCDVVDQYVKLANSFSQDLADVISDPIFLIFGALVGLWIVINGIKMIVGKLDIIGLGHELIFVIIAAFLLAGQGPKLVNQVYGVALSTMGGAASMVLSAGEISGKTNISTSGAPSGSASGIANVDGMVKLVWVAEQGVYKVFQMASEMMSQATLSNFGAPIIYAALLALPYFILLVVYFAQVVLSIFRVAMFAALSPILMLGVGFGWGRGMAETGLRTLFASFMVLFGATVALAICLYGVAALNVANADDIKNVRSILSLDNPKLWVAIILGWLGTAFITEATGMANSIAGSQLTNTAVGVITGGVLGSAAAAAKWGKGTGLPMAGNAAAGISKAFGWGQAAMGDPAGAKADIQARTEELMKKVKTPTFDQGGK